MRRNIVEWENEWVGMYGYWTRVEHEEYDCGGGGVDACMAGWMEVYVYMYVFM